MIRLKAQLELLRDMSRLQLVELTLTAAAAILCVAVLWTFISRVTWGGTTLSWADPPHEAAASSGVAAHEGSQPPARIAAALNAVTSRNIFSPPKPKGFQGQIVGVIGDHVVFTNHQAGSVGKTVMGAKILEIGPDWVRIEFEGHEQTIHVFGRHGGKTRPGIPSGGHLGVDIFMSQQGSMPDAATGESTQDSPTVSRHRRFRRNFHARNGG